MSKHTIVTAALLVLTATLVGCSVGPQYAHQQIQVRPMSESSRAALEAKASESSSALSRMDAYRASLQRGGS